MLRWLATLAIVALFVLNWGLPGTALGRRGNERTVQAHVEEASRWVGQPLPELTFEDAAGRAVRLGDLIDHPVLLVFERSVDW